MSIADHRRAAARLQAGGEQAGFEPFGAESVEGSITARFRAQAERHPSHVAVRSDEGDMTYAALARLARRIAAAATRRGRANVAVLCRPGGDAVAAMLGVLQAGRAYVPLDPSFPAIRLQQILDDVEADLVIADRASAAPAMTLRRRSTSLLVTDEIDGGPDEAEGVDVGPDATAYVLYTSGSTGRPKGVAQTHRNLLHFIRSYTNSLRIGPHDRLSLVCPLSFSAALMDIYGSTLNGATLCSYDVRQRGSACLPDWIDREAVTILHCVPTLFRQLLLGLDRDRRFATVRTIDLGGESVHAGDVAAYRAHFGADCVLINHLACSEVSVLAQYYLDRESDVGAGRVPAGPVADGVAVRVVGPDGTSLPAGEIGELVVESRYVSSGSCREVAAVARGARAPRNVFRTGDLARLGADGMLEHLGRAGTRVKIRGHSVEPAEVERALLEVDGVREAAVVGQPLRRGDSDAVTLVAYVTASDGQALSVDSLRRGLAARLPAFSTPSRFLQLDALPLTTSGKIDRRALPACTGRRPALEQAFVQPRSDLECRLTSIWGRVLGLDQVGIDDDFFTLGGDSFSAVQLMVQIEAELRHALPPMSLTAAPTVRQLAAGMTAGGDALGGEWQRVRTGDARPPLLFLPGIRGTSLSFGALCAHVDPQRAGFAFHYPGVYGGETPLRRVEALAERALAGLRSIQARGPYHLCGYSFGGLVAYEMACRLRADGEDVSLLALFDTRGPGFTPRPTVQRLLVHARRLRATSDKLGYVRDRALAAYERLARRRALRPANALAALLPTPALRAVVAACLEAARLYRPAAYPGRLTVLRTPEPGLEFWYPDPQFGWGSLARAGVDVYDIPMHHDDILRPDNLAPVAQCLAQALAASARLTLIAASAG
jgi:amino acid adenylation domain-containing protein